MIDRIPRAPGAVTWIARRLEEAGYETWAVGGAVRDALAGRGSGDWDLATRARPGQVRRLFRRTVPIGLEHGTVGVLAGDGTLYEVTTFRRDVETHGRRAVVEFADTLEEDLARRDFTINAIAWHPLRDELLDPFEGLRDLERGVVRTVGDPELRFAEDYLRVLRALRFAGQFRFGVDATTWRALCAAADRLDLLSPERVREELLKVMTGSRRPSAALGLYAASGALATLYPELEEAVGAPAPGAEAGDRWSHALLVADALPAARPRLRMAALLHAVGNALRDPGVPRRVAALLVRLRFSNAETDELAGLVAGGLEPPPLAPDRAEARRWLARVGPARLPGAARVWLASARVAACRDGRDPRPLLTSLGEVRRELRRRPPLGLPDLALDGRDLIRMGLDPGPLFGRVLSHLLDRVLADPGVNSRDRLEELVRDYLAEREEGVAGSAGTEDA